MKKSQIDSNFNQFEKLFQNVCVAKILIINENLEVLMGKKQHEPYRGCIEIPGGKLKNHETYIQAVIRELTEETGLDLKFPKLVHRGSMIDGRFFVHFAIFRNRLSDCSGEIRDSAELSNLRFYSIYNPPFDEMCPEAQKIWQDIFSDNSYFFKIFKGLDNICCQKELLINHKTIRPSVLEKN